MRKPTKSQQAHRVYEAERRVLGCAILLRDALRYLEQTQRTPRLASALIACEGMQRSLCEAVEALHKAKGGG